MSGADDAYLLSRGIAPSMRLLAQHWLWKDHFGWNVHPTARKRLESVCDSRGEASSVMIADVATGNAIWLVEEAQTLPPGSRAIGFDISGAMFPAQHTLAQNVKLEILDAAADVPLEYIDAFDLIHIRLVLAAVYNNDPRPILRNMIRMLKPGGVLQWGEIMLDAYVLGKPREGQKTASMKIMALIAQQIGTTAVAPEDSWLINLPSIFEECGLQGVECARAGEPRREMWKYWGNVLSAAIEEIVAVSRLGREYLRDLAAENDRGDYVYVEPRIVTGYKIV